MRMIFKDKVKHIFPYCMVFITKHGAIYKGLCKFCTFQKISFLCIVSHPENYRKSIYINPIQSSLCISYYLKKCVSTNCKLFELN